MCTFAFFLSSLLSTLGGEKPNKVTFLKKVYVYTADTINWNKTS